MSRKRAVLVVWLAVTCWNGGLHLRAALSPPPGRAFAGNFHWIDDFYHYLSYARQAEDGQLLFRNRLARSGPPILFNAEWWLVGMLSRLLGGRPLLAYWTFGAAAALAMLAAAERWLTGLRVPRSHLTAALLLTAFGGGLGGLLFELTDLGTRSCLDLGTGAFPFLEFVGNPHFVAGTALLLWSAWLLSEPAPWGPWLGVLLGSLLVLVRPYEIGLLLAMRVAVVGLREPRPRWRAALLPLLGLVPVLAYAVWVFFGNEQFSTFRQGGTFPSPLAWAVALGPAALLAAAEPRRTAVDDAQRRTRTQLWTWAAVSLALVIARPGGIALQLLVGSGVPLLLLGAAALAGRERRVLVLAALCFSCSAVVETRILLQDDPNWFVPRERLATARALGDLCRPGDRVLAPPDVSLFALGFSSCDAFVAHPAARDYDARLAATVAFYAGLAPPLRSAFLDDERVSHLVLPGWAGERPVGWLGAATPFRVAAVIGSPQPAVSVYARAGRPTAPR